MRSWRMVKELKNDTVVLGEEEVDEVVEEALSPFSFWEGKGQIQREKWRETTLHIFSSIIFSIINLISTKW